MIEYLNHILVPLDDSTSALEGVKFAVSLGHVFNEASITGILLSKYTWPTTIGDKIRKKAIPESQALAQVAFQRCQVMCERENLMFNGIVHSSNLKKAVSNISDEEGIVVLSAAGNEDSWGGYWLRSNLDKLLKSVALPVVVVPVPFNQRFSQIQKVVFAYEDKQKSEHLAQLVALICRRSGAHLHVVTVTGEKRGATGVLSPELTTKFEGIEWNQECVALTDVDSVAHGIFTVVNREGAELLAMGARVRNRFRERLTPNTTRTLLNASPCPILFSSQHEKAHRRRLAQM